MYCLPGSEMQWCFHCAVSTSNHMFGRAIWDKLPECIFENFEIARVKRGYWSITSNQQTLCIETNIF